MQAWSVVSFDRFFDIPKMQAFVTFLVGQMKTVGINVPNERPACIGPHNPNAAGNVVSRFVLSPRPETDNPDTPTLSSSKDCRKRPRPLLMLARAPLLSS